MQGENVKLNDDQQDALDAVLEWYYNSSRQSFILGGFAGTGKTTLLKMIRDAIKSNIRFVCPTNKAADVLRTKLPHGSHVSTLHNLLYIANPVIKRDPFGEEDIRVYEYIPKAKLTKGNEPNIRLIIIDEASMVQEGTWRLLLSHGIKTLAVGDHGQLPPVSSNNDGDDDDFNLMYDTDIRLERIMRQENDSPILRMATMAREDGHIPFGDYGQGCMKITKREALKLGVLSEMEPEYGDLVLCGYNRTRIQKNREFRLQRGVDISASHLFRTPSQRPASKSYRPPSNSRSQSIYVPFPGEVVICRNNNHRAGVFNGQRGIVTDFEYRGDMYGDVDDEDETFAYLGVEMMDTGIEFDGMIDCKQFNWRHRHPVMPRNISEGLEIGLFDFGYCITVHAAQGSEADRVLIYEEILPDMEHSRWLYTAVTRARKELIIVANNTRQLEES